MFQNTTIEIGMIATTLALLLAIAAAGFSLAGRVLVRPAYVTVARLALYVNFALVTLAIATIVHAFVTKDFSVAYVAQNSNSQLPLMYRLTALWGAHEGSLMLWLWYLVLFSALAGYLHHKTHPLSMPYILATLAGIQVGFLSFILFLSSPFTEIIPALPEGRDLNPLLQDPGLIFHPPLLYMGYVGFSVPFAFAIAALARGQLTTEWVVATRRWSLFAWTALTTGIMLGGYWSYYELGWGGYWAWDPVENASFMPWLTATAFLHSSMAQERRHLFNGWNLFLIIATFSLSLMGTFLVRSGVLTSVHAFATDPGRGAFILAFLAVVLFVSLGLLVRRANMLGGGSGIVAPVSRESALLYNNLLFIVALFTVFLGTMLPLLAEFVTNDRVTVGPPYFNQVMAPLMLAIVVLMAIGPVVPWRRASPKLLTRQFLTAGAMAVVCVIALLLFGITNILALVAAAIIAFASWATLADVYRASKVRANVIEKSILSGFSDLFFANPRRYGGLIVHLGILVICIGLVGSGLFKETKTVVLSVNDRFEIGDYVVTYHGISDVKGPNYSARSASFSAQYHGQSYGDLITEKRSYPRGNMVTTEAALLTGFWEDLHIVLGGESGNGQISLRAYRNPLVTWIWLGWLIIAIGSVVAFSARPSRRQMDRSTDQEVMA